MLRIGEQIMDRYEVLALLGEGGTAEVYRVRHIHLGTFHAVKMLTMSYPRLVQRLLQEGRIQATLRHPNIVAVTDMIMHQGQPGLLMEFVEGCSLETALRREGAPDLDDALDLFSQILAGVSVAHRAGVLHRDLKPANILLATTDAGTIPKVADFGIARVTRAPGVVGITREGATLGTPGYMAPEQLEDSTSIDARADIFALGCILYELVTGVRAFPSESIRDNQNAAATGGYLPAEVLRPDLPEPVRAAIVTALSPEPQDRFSNCNAFGEAALVDHPELMARLRPGQLPSGPMRPLKWPKAAVQTTQGLAIGALSLPSEAVKTYYPATSGDIPRATSDERSAPPVIRVSNGDLMERWRWVVLGSVAVACMMLGMALARGWSEGRTDPSISTPVAGGDTVQPILSPLPVAVASASAPISAVEGRWTGEPWNLTLSSRGTSYLSGTLSWGDSGTVLPVNGSYDPSSGSLELVESRYGHYVLHGSLKQDTISGAYRVDGADPAVPWAVTRAAAPQSPTPSVAPHALIHPPPSQPEPGSDINIHR